MPSVLKDLKFACRLLARNPGLTAAIVLILALAIGANTAIFSVVSSALLRHMPWKNVDRMVLVDEANQSLGVRGDAISMADFKDWKDRQQVFESMTAWRFLYFNISGRDQPERVQGFKVDATFFPLLGVEPALGRNFIPEEMKPGSDAVAILTDGLWRRRFGGDPGLVGQKITIEASSFTVVGILPPSFWIFQVLNHDVDLFAPLTVNPKETSHASHDTNLYALLKPGVSIVQARAHMDAIYRDLEQQYPETNRGWAVRVRPLDGAWTDANKSVVLTLVAAVCLVLLLACANIANLLLARAASRSKEIAVRMALGAGPMRVIGQLLAESVLLSILGAAAGVVLAIWGTDFLDRLIPFSAIRRVGRFTIDWQTLGFALTVSCLTGIIFGIAPALYSSKPRLSESLKQGGRSGAAAGSGQRVRNALAITEVALAVTLLIGATLVIRSSVRLRNLPRGVRADNVLLMMQVWLPSNRYRQAPQITDFFSQVLNRVKSLPGVDAASVVNFPPVDIIDPSVAFTVDDRPRDDSASLASYKIINPDYFRVFGMPILAGRNFSDADGVGAAGVAIVSQTMAQTLWPGEDPLGRRITPHFPEQDLYWLPRSASQPRTVIGVVNDVRQDGLPTGTLMQMYLPYLQNPASFLHLAIRTRTDPMKWAGAVKSEVAAVDADEPVYEIRTMDDVIARSFSQPRISSVLLSAFAALALVLAVVGIYSVMSYGTSQRTQEIGVRLALGARCDTIVKSIVAEGLILSGTGAVIGAAAAFGFTRLLSGLLFGVSAADPWTFALIPLSLLVIALVACYIPARRAARLDPMAVLRCE
jgi:putative ABC transport system permease protein